MTRIRIFGSSWKESEVTMNFKNRILIKVKARQKELSEKMEKIRFKTDEQSLSTFRLYSHRKNEVD